MNKCKCLVSPSGEIQSKVNFYFFTTANSESSIESADELLSEPTLSRLGPDLLDIIICKLPLEDRFSLREAFPGTSVDVVVQRVLARQKGLCLLVEKREVFKKVGFKINPQYGFRVNDPLKIPLLLTSLKGFSRPNSSEEMVTIDYPTLKKMLKFTKSNMKTNLKQTFPKLSTLKLVSLTPNLNKLKVIREVLATFGPYLVELQLFIESIKFEKELHVYERISESVFSQTGYLFDDLNTLENFQKLKHLTLHLNTCLHLPANSKNNSSSVFEDSDNFDDDEDFADDEESEKNLDENSESYSEEDFYESSEENFDEEFEKFFLKSKALTLLGQVEEAYLSLPPCIFIENIVVLGNNPNLVKLGIIISGFSSSTATHSFLKVFAETYPSLTRKVVHFLQEKWQFDFEHPSFFSLFERPLLAHQFSQLTHLSVEVITAQYVTILKELGKTCSKNSNFNQSLRELSFTLTFENTDELILLEALNDAHPLPSVTSFTLNLNGVLENHETFEKIVPLGQFFSGELRYFYLKLRNCPGKKGSVPIVSNSKMKLIVFGQC